MDMDTKWEVLSPATSFTWMTLNYMERMMTNQKDIKNVKKISDNSQDRVKEGQMKTMHKLPNKLV